MAILSLLALTCGVGLTGLHLGSAAIVARRLRRPASPPQQTTRPFITLLRPVCGVDRHDEETLQSSFDQDYPDYEIIFCAADPADPAVALVNRLIAANPAAKARLLLGDDRISGNPKLNNLQKGWLAAQGAFVAMTDSNLLLPRDYLTQLIGLMDDRTGLVTSPPLGLRAEGMAGRVECAVLNTFQGRWQLLADELGLGFAQGKTLFWRRSVLDQAGGLVALSHDMAEDVASTKVVRRAGLVVRLTQRPFVQPIGRRGWRAIWDRQLRWSRVRRQGFFGLFLLELLAGPMAPALALWGAGLPGGGLIAWLLLWYGAEVAFARIVRWPMGWGDVLALVIRDAMLWPLWVATFPKKGFEWRGTKMSSGSAPG